MKREEFATLVESEFISFLKENGAYAAFTTNLKEQRGLKLHQFISTLLYGGDAISASFTWDETTEGKAFWSDISTEWELKYTELEANNKG